MSTFFGILAFLSVVAIIFGLIKPEKAVFWGKKKTRGMAALIYGIAFIIFLIIAISTSGGTKPVAATTSSASTSSAADTAANSDKGASSDTASSKSTTPATIKVDKTLDSGNYTVGTDIPAGTYNFTATKGGGNVTTDDGSINEIMGTKDKGSEYTQTFSNANLQDGQVLSISGLTLQLTCDNALGTVLKGRDQKISKTYTFSSGNYTSGKDFEAGTYSLTAVSGGGNVTTADGSLNTILGTSNDDMYLKSYQNVNLTDGTVLQIAGGVKVQLTPSK